MDHKSTTPFTFVVRPGYGHVAEWHVRLLAGVDLDNRKAACRGRLLTLHNGSTFQTHIGHMAAEIARPTGAIRSITATALQHKHSFDANHQPLALNPCA